MQKVMLLLEHKMARLIMAALGILIGVGSAIFLSGGYVAAQGRSSDQSANSLTSAGQDAFFYALSDFVRRSPGERGEVDSIKGTLASLAAAPFVGAPGGAPSQRALGKIFDPETALFDEAAAPGVPEFAPVGDFTPLAPLVQGVPPDIGGGNLGSIGGTTTPNPGFTPLVLAPGASGSVPDNGGSTPGPVPEPGTWVMLIVGFMLTGCWLRRTHAKSARLGSANT